MGTAKLPASCGGSATNSHATGAISPAYSTPRSGNACDSSQRSSNSADSGVIPDAIKALIGRLQIPILKVAILDKKFFSNKTHPTRKLLDSLGTPPGDLAGRAEELRGLGQTVMFVVIGDRVAGILGVADPIKDNTPHAIAALHEEGMRIVMLTGDSQETAHAVAGRAVHR